MQTDTKNCAEDALALRETKKRERREAMAELKRVHVLDPEKAREAARLWIEANAGPREAEDSAFHQRKLSESDPGRSSDAADAVRKCEADAERAQKASRVAVKEWKKRNPNKVKKLNQLFKEQHKSK